MVREIWSGKYGQGNMVREILSWYVIFYTGKNISLAANRN